MPGHNHGGVFACRRVADSDRGITSLTAEYHWIVGEQVYRGGVPGIIIWSRPFLSHRRCVAVIRRTDKALYLSRVTQDVVNRRAVPVAMSRTRFRSRVITAMLASLRADRNAVELPICSGARRSNAAVPQTSADVTTDTPEVPRCLVRRKSESALPGSPAIAVRVNPCSYARRSHRHATWPTITAGDQYPARIESAGPVLTPCRRWHLAQGR